MTTDTQDYINLKELKTTKFGMAGKAAQSQTSDAKQGTLDAYADGTKGLDTVGRMEALYDLVLEMRTVLVENGMMKGGA